MRSKLDRGFQSTKDPYAYDATVIRISCDNNINKALLAPVFLALASEAGITEKMYKIHGADTPSKSFTVEMLSPDGDAATARRRVSKIFDLLKGGGNGWRTIYIRKPDGMDEKLFINPDRCFAETSCERATKFLHTIISAECSEEVFAFHKRKCEI